MTALARAQALLEDHREGRHAEADDPIDGCQWPGCEEAYWIVARAEELADAFGDTLGSMVAAACEEIESEFPAGVRVVLDTSPLIRFGAP